MKDGGTYCSSSEISISRWFCFRLCCLADRLQIRLSRCLLEHPLGIALKHPVAVNPHQLLVRVGGRSYVPLFVTCQVLCSMLSPWLAARTESQRLLARYNCRLSPGTDAPSNTQSCTLGCFHRSTQGCRIIWLGKQSWLVSWILFSLTLPPFLNNFRSTDAPRNNVLLQRKNSFLSFYQARNQVN